MNKQETLARVTHTGTAFDGATVEVIRKSDTLADHYIVKLIGYETVLSVKDGNLERF